MSEVEWRFGNVKMLNDVGNTFILMYNETSDDSLHITDSEFESGKIEHILYVASALDEKFTYIFIDNCQNYHKFNIK